MLHVFDAALRMDAIMEDLAFSDAEIGTPRSVTQQLPPHTLNAEPHSCIIGQNIASFLPKQSDLLCLKT